MSDPDKDFLSEAAGLPSSDPGSTAAALGRDVRRLMRQAQDEEAARLAGQSSQPLTAEEQASIQRTRARLQAQGLIDLPEPQAPQPARPAHAQPKQSPTSGNWLQALRDTLLGTGWQGGLAFAMVAFFAVAVLLPQHDKPVEDEMRGQATQPGEQLVVASDPQTRQAELQVRLSAAGAEVVSTQLSDHVWTLVVTIGSPDVAQKVNTVLVAEKLRPLDAGQGSLTITVKR